MNTLYADSFGGLTQAQLARDQFQQAQMASQFQNLASAIQNAQTRGMQGRQFQYQQDQDTALARERATSRTDTLAENTRRHDLALGNQKISQGYLDLQKNQPTAARNKMRETIFAYATEGMFDKPDEVLKLDPTMTAEEAGLISKYSADSRKEIESEYSIAKNAASILNRVAAIDAKMREADTDIAKARKQTRGGVLAMAPGGRPYTGPDLTSQITSMEGSKKKMGESRLRYAEMADRIQKDPRLSQSITFDAESGQYVPTIPTPRWMQSKASTKTGAGGKTAPTPAPTAAQGQFEPEFYDRVNELIAAGFPPVQARQRVLREREAAVSQQQAPVMQQQIDPQILQQLQQLMMMTNGVQAPQGTQFQRGSGIFMPQ